MKVPDDNPHTRPAAVSPEVGSCVPGKAASVLSIHRTSEGHVRYCQWPNGLITVELLAAVGPVPTGGRPGPGERPGIPSDEQDAPPDAIEPVPAPTWQICAIVGARRRRG
jgi:hypothetical protein